MPVQTPHEPPEEGPRQSVQRDYAKGAGLGFEFAFTVGVFAWLGWWGDRALGIDDVFPALLLGGVFAGLALAIYRLMLKTGQVGKPEDQEEE